MKDHSAIILYEGQKRTVVFDPSKFSAQEARQWLKDNGYEIIEFTAGETKKPTVKKVKKQS
jgi:hypothetical protein